MTSSSWQAARPTPLPTRKIATYLLLLLNCLSPLAAIVIAPSLPKMQAAYAAVPHVEFLVPVLLTIPGLMIALLSPLVGWLSDRWGRKHLLVVATFAYGVLGVLPMLLDSLHAIVASRVGLGIAEAFVVTISTSLIGDYYSGALRRRYLALQTTFASSSAIVFFTIGGMLGELGWRIPYLVYLVSIGLAVCASFLLWEPDRSTTAADDDEETSSAAAFRPALMAAVYLAAFIGAISFMALQINLPYVLEAVGEPSPKVAGLVASACSVCIMLGTLSIHLLMRWRYRLSHSFALAFGLIALSFLFIAKAHSTQDVLIASLLNGLGCGLLLPSLLIWNMRELPARLRGLGTGLWCGFYYLGLFLCPVIVVSVGKITGSTASAIGLGAWVLFPLAVVALIIAVVAGRPKLTLPASRGPLEHNPGGH